MARLARSGRLESVESRRKLTIQKEPYWRMLFLGLYLGYRKNTVSSGTWVVRRLTTGKRYEQLKLGEADDIQNADCERILSYQQAHSRALAIAQRYGRDSEERQTRSENLTVADVMQKYVQYLSAHRKAAKSAESAINAHILPALGKKNVHRLTAQVIRHWHENLATQPAKLRSGIGRAENGRTVLASDVEAIRRRRATANRVLTSLKAGLNRAYHDGLLESDQAWRRVRPFRSTETPCIRFLSVSECQRLIKACAPDFRRLVQGGLLTGCRYGELTRLKCGDFHRDSKTIVIRDGKSGKARHVYLTDEGTEFFDSVTAGRKGIETVFSTAAGTPWGQSYQARPLKFASEKAGIQPAISFHILRHTYASFLAQQGVALQVIAEALGHADTRVTHRHYAHLQPDYVAHVIRSNLPNLGIERTRVASIEKRSSARKQLAAS